MGDLKPPAPNPCGSCPYRRDVASGIWDASEYEKLAAYDEETFAQPQGIFLCHQQDGRACAGWCAVHDMAHSLALRLGAHRIDSDTLNAILDYETPVDVFLSGTEAAQHGLADVMDPDARARRQIARLEQKAARRGD